MDLHLEDFIEGFLAYSKIKQAQESSIFSINGNVKLFPISNTQSKWKYAKGNGVLHLMDGENVFVFHFPSGESKETDFPITRKEDLHKHQFGEGLSSKGLAQVHRSDPGSIYFTLQEGKENPTYTFKHISENTWKGIPKRKKTIVKNVSPDAVKQGMEQALSKSAGIGETLNNGFKYITGDGLNKLEGYARLPGANPLKAGLIGAGAGAGALYHLGKQHLYNTPEENEEEAEQGVSVPLRRVLLPGLGLGLTGLIQKSLTKKYYDPVNNQAFRLLGN